MRVFLTGGSGHIGRAVAGALMRAGHEVHGLARSPAKARALEADGIRPVLGDLARPEGWRAAAAAADALVHAAADMSAGTVEPDRIAIETMLEASKRGPRPTTLVYTSGVWVLGDTGGRAADESAPLAPIPIVAWRPAHERLVLGAAGVRGIVVRPGCVYGGGGSLTSGWFESAEEQGAARVVGDGGNAWTMVHREDLADAYVRLVEKAPGGEVFHVSEARRESVRACAEAASRAAGKGGAVAVVPLAEARRAMGPFADALVLDQAVDPAKAKRRLGWEPRHRGFVAEAEALYREWKAARA
ncbi:MAG TPA: NAD-dependent epimerase/dehydratase family protein [Vicinamibacteria bacterium]|nr:NAD-dependent epimerase/dehydratase family protein [Vicinamibacteria bacterium]